MSTVAKWLIAAAMTGIGSAAIAADTQFNVTGQFQSGGTLSGELMINTVTGSFDSASLVVAGSYDFNNPYATYHGGTFNGTYGATGLAGPLSPPLPVAISFELNAAGHFNTFDIYVPVSSLVGFQGASILTESATGLPSGLDHYSAFDFLTSGSITLAAPEIDAASAASGLTLLLGSLMVLRGRRSGVVAA